MIRSSLRGARLADFARRTSNGQWLPYRHLLFICAELEWAERTPGARLMIQCPPRHGKSWTTSWYFPAWSLLRRPSRRIILASYEGGYATYWGRRVRDLVHRIGPHVLVDVSDTSSAAAEWELTTPGVAGTLGGMLCVGMTSGVTGRGADLLLMDDPVKDAEQARSQTYRNRAWDWWNATGGTRLEPGAAAIGIWTRWHEDDLGGRLLAEEGRLEEGGAWKVISLPALAEEDDPLGRAPGEALCPERYDEAYLLKRKAADNFWFAALYQQHPSPPDGTQFKREGVRWFYEDNDDFVLIESDKGEVRVPQKQCSRFTTADLAISEAEGAHFTVFSTWAYTGSGKAATNGKLLCLDVDRRRLAGPDQLPALQATMAANRSSVAFIEAVAYQSSLVQQARRAGLNARKAAGTYGGDKVMRAQPAAAKWNAGDIYINRRGSWQIDFIEEHIKFPRGTYDDQVDTTAYAAVEAASLQSAVLPAPRSFSRASPWR